MSLPNDLIAFDKPSGITTDAPDANTKTKNNTFAEALSHLAGKRMGSVHRLDEGVTGVVAVTALPLVTSDARAAFAGDRAYQVYLFISDGKSDRLEFEAASAVAGAAALTRFRRIRTNGRLALWEARLATEHTHQVRDHAAKNGIPVLGDIERGGADFPQLMLHALELRIAGMIDCRSAPPLLMDRLDLCERPRLAQWLCAHDRRERWMRSRSQAALLGGNQRAADTDCWRRVHSDGGPLRSEKLGEVEWLGWFAPTPPSEVELDEIREFLKIIGRPLWILQHRNDRGGAVTKERFELSSQGTPLRWIARENGVAYEMRRDQGLSSGLFLDQRANRLRMAGVTRGSVLNLFSYAGAFGLCAALAGCKRVVSVDISKPFLEWSKSNFVLNGLEPQLHEFRAIDSRAYLHWAARKRLQFDLVVCDPPSFSRGEKGIFRIERDLPDLAADVARVLAPGGEALFATNFEGWDQNEFERILTAVSPRGVQLAEAESTEWDFELPREPRQMKCARLVSAIGSAIGSAEA